MTSHFDKMIELGYHPIPVNPEQKFPARKSFGTWYPMHDWTKFKDKAPTKYQTMIWDKWESSIGLVTGTKTTEGCFVVLDIDTEDTNEMLMILEIFPDYNTAKIGKKGLSIFLNAPADYPSKQYKNEDGEVICEILGGGKSCRQTVIPPSIHPDTQVPYKWTRGPIHVDYLTKMSQSQSNELEDLMKQFGWKQVEQSTIDFTKKEFRNNDDSIFNDIDILALNNLDKWVPQLDLYGLVRVRDGYKCVPTWRESSTGRATSERKKSLSFANRGIVDFGTGKRYGPLTLVMQVNQCQLSQAYSWLSSQLYDTMS